MRPVLKTAARIVRHWNAAPYPAFTIFICLQTLQLKYLCTSVMISTTIFFFFVIVTETKMLQLCTKTDLSAA